MVERQDHTTGGVASHRTGGVVLPLLRVGAESGGLEVWRFGGSELPQFLENRRHARQMHLGATI